MQRPNPLTDTITEVRETPYSSGEWRIVACRETGMVFLENPPSYDQLESEFAWEKTFAAERTRRQQEEPVYSKVSALAKGARRLVRRRKRFETETCKLLRDVGRAGPIFLLDVGCGNGGLGYRIAKHSREEDKIDVRPIGIEVSLGLAQAASERLQELGGYCVQDAALNALAKLDADSIDVVMLCSYLEHEANPLAVLRAIGRVLRPDGRILIKVPNFASWNRVIRGKRWCGFRYPDHVNYFTPRTLGLMIEAAGLEVKRMSFIDTIPTSDNCWAIAGRSR